MAYRCERIVHLHPSAVYLPGYLPQQVQGIVIPQTIIRIMHNALLWRDLLPVVQAKSSLVLEHLFILFHSRGHLAGEARRNLSQHPLH